MKIKPILIVLAFLILGLGCGALLGNFFRTTPHAQITAGDFQGIVESSGKDIVMFSLSTCPHCRDAREYLTVKHIPYVEFQVDKSKQAMQKFKALNETAVPVIFTRHYKMLGFTPQDMDKLLELSAVKGG